MTLVRETRAAPSSLKEMGRSLAAVWKFRSPKPANCATLRGVAAFPRRPIPFLWHYVRRRPLLHFTALAAVLGAAAAACVAQYGLKLIVDAMAQGATHMTAVWWALAVFLGLLAGESLLWRSGSWLGYRAMLTDKAEARLDLFDHLGGHSSRYFTDVMSGSLASRVSSTGDPVQQVQQLTSCRGVDYSFEVIGLPETTLQAFNMIRKGGTAVMVGMTRAEATVTLSTFDLFFNEKTLKGCKYGSGQVRRDFQRFADLIETGRLDTSSMVSRTIKLDEVNEAFRAMEAGEVIRSVITAF